MNSKQFLIATETVNSLLKKPSHNELSELYGLYKQAILGDNTNAEPSMLNFKEHAKWKAWSQNKSLNKYNAEVKYITLVNELIEKYGLLWNALHFLINNVKLEAYFIEKNENILF